MDNHGVQVMHCTDCASVWVVETRATRMGSEPSTCAVRPPQAHPRTNMLDLPTYAWPFIFAIVAAVAGRLLGGRLKDDPDSMPTRLLYYVAAACSAVGLATLWLTYNA